MSQWIRVAKKNAIPSDTGLLVEAGGQEIALFNINGKICAIHAVCPHQGGPLAEGGIDGTVVTCPWHGWQFDVTTGVCTFNDAIKQPTFPVKEEGEDVSVEV